jgi:hypothetical protein
MAGTSYRKKCTIVSCSLHVLRSDLARGVASLLCLFTEISTNKPIILTAKEEETAHSFSSRAAQVTLQIMNPVCRWDSLVLDERRKGGFPVGVPKRVSNKRFDSKRWLERVSTKCSLTEAVLALELYQGVCIMQFLLAAATRTLFADIRLSQCGGPKKETNHTSFFQLKRTAVTPFTQSKRAHKCITFQQ